MRFMVLVKASKESEAGDLPSRELLEKMGKFNHQLAEAGLLLAGEGLQATSKGARVEYAGFDRRVTDGPFALSKELVSGFWLLKARSKDEAVEWMMRAPFQDGEVEIRQVLEFEDFAPSDPSGALRETEHRLRESIP